MHMVVQGGRRARHGVRDGEDDCCRKGITASEGSGARERSPVCWRVSVRRQTSRRDDVSTQDAHAGIKTMEFMKTITVLK